MRYLLLTLISVSMLVPSVEADVLYGRDYFNLPYPAYLGFDSGAWSVSGDGMTVYTEQIFLSAYQTTAMNGDAVVGNAGVAEGVEFQVFFEGLWGYASLAVIDNAGFERVRLYCDNGEVYGMFEGALFGPLIRSDSNIFQVSLLTPASGEELAWTISAAENEFDQSLNVVGASRSTAAPFTGQMTLQMNADPDMGVFVNFVRIIGDNIVSNENLSWASVKALYK